MLFMKALFIGRFQPFHKGHLMIIKNISKTYDQIIIGIGSSQYGHISENPFTSEERIEMINKTLDRNDIKNYKIILIPDIHNPPKWVDHVKSIIKDFDVIITNNLFTKSLFLEKKYEVIDTPLYKKEIYSGKVIREKIKNGEKWEDLVPEEVERYIKRINGINRLKKI